MVKKQPGLFGIRYSNRDFLQKKAWGKNCFNSSFPTALCCYLHDINLENIYIKVNSNLEIEHTKIATEDVFGINPQSDLAFYAFESPFTPYQQYLIGTLPRVDLVTQTNGLCLRPMEIKLTALPDNTTCELPENEYGCEIVVRPDTIVYLACSIASTLRQQGTNIAELLKLTFPQDLDWTEPLSVIPYVSTMIEAIDNLMSHIVLGQKPFLMQPIWKTQGKSPQLSTNCLDVFIWSDICFSRLFVNLAKQEIKTFGKIIKISRYTRTVIWLYKMLSDFADRGLFDYVSIIDSCSYNTKNDKAFAVNGKITHEYMKSEYLRKPRILKQEIKNIILGDGQNLLSPERRFDAIIYNSPDLFLP
ncbi:HindVP family restriction endonuclease [Arthrospira platensis]|nr:HindVP family restriction endonuclease [Arthrospira platensis]AMW31458.1 restriction endonuclease [Arthrospira platensis YZ]KDR57348.1 restriction endonuclease HindVP [Arthrospira platensis str. Paraca]MBD2669344.1 HindVP family restriction endonuclease [Arthrospira platensis FACHB-439]MBD2709758.1 HindVP family restriction endonuclease [Arthrospira platensis FACHB-835]MDF2211759.1 HindVP family restriction endonuclease [Arthrospira platensis NCB002]MDT9182288.1 HindVP family restriction e